MYVFFLIKIFVAIYFFFCKKANVIILLVVRQQCSADMIETSNQLIRFSLVVVCVCAL